MCGTLGPRAVPTHPRTSSLVRGYAVIPDIQSASLVKPDLPVALDTQVGWGRMTRMTRIAVWLGSQYGSPESV